jgi:hypothetical protein
MFLQIQFIAKKGTNNSWVRTFEALEAIKEEGKRTPQKENVSRNEKTTKEDDGSAFLTYLLIKIPRKFNK